MNPMVHCPVCQTEYTPSDTEKCFTCGWDLTVRLPHSTIRDYQQREERRLTWARQMWTTLQVQSPLITLLRDIQGQLSQGSEERQEIHKLLHQLCQQLDQSVIENPVSSGVSGEVVPHSVVAVSPPLPTAWNYNRLEYLLAQQRWREADQETARLMIAIAQREKQNYLIHSDLATFPCRELTRLDQLWLNASQGRFGFSVQRQLYIELGGTRFLQPSIWQAMGQKVGWVKEEIWLRYDQLEFSLNAPWGHLPVLGDGQVWFVSGWDGANQGFAALVSRLVKCRV